MNRRNLALTIFFGLLELFSTVAMGGPWDANRQRPPGFQRTLAYLENDLYDYPLPELQSVRNMVLHGDMVAYLIAEFKRGGYPPQDWESRGQWLFHDKASTYGQVQMAFADKFPTAGAILQAIDEGRPVSADWLRQPLIKDMIMVHWDMLWIAEGTYQAVLYANGGIAPLRPSPDNIRREITKNLRELGYAAEQYYLENGKNAAKFSDLVGAGKILKGVTPVDGEDYATLVFKRGANLRIVSAGGVAVTYTPDSPVPTPTTTAATTALAKPKAAAASTPGAVSRVVDAHGPPLAPLPLARGGTGSGAVRNPPVIRDTKGGPQGWLPVSDEEKAKQAKERNDFKQRMATKQKKIEEMKKQKAKEDTARFDNNITIFQAWANQKKQEVAARDKMMIEKLRAAESRSDAVSYYIETINGAPHIVLKNNTDCALYIEYSYTGTIDGKPLNWEPGGWTILPSGLPPEKDVLPAFFGESSRGNSTAQIVKIRWWAREQDNRWRN